MSDLLQDVADALASAAREKRTVPPIAARLGDASVDQAYRIQDINTERWIGEGRVPIGRKIGLTSRAVQQAFGIDQPDYGMLFADMAYGDGEPISLSSLIQPRIEGEVAFVLGRDLDEDVTLPRLLSAIDYAVAALEVVDSRIADWKIGILDTVADNASSGIFVLGTGPVKLDAFDHRLCGMVIMNQGEPVSTGAGAACLGNPLIASLWLAKKMVEVGRPLRAGDTILSGALGPMLPVSRPGVYDLRVSGVGSVRAVFKD
jgi:2-keto-4-pentenoate hydratase